MEYKNYILGLDIGTTSIGWGITPTDIDPEDEDIEILSGVRIFPEGVKRGKNKISEAPLNTERREKRSGRRQHKRKRMRRDSLKKILERNGFLPKDEDKLLKLNQLDPYRLRKEALDNIVSKYELGRLLLHINKRRGFQSNRKTFAKKEDGVVLSSISELESSIKKSPARTIGEFLFDLKNKMNEKNHDKKDKRIRGKYTERSMYKHEFDLIIGKQSQYHHDLKEIHENIREKIFSQRPITSGKNVGLCSLEKEEKRCPIANWYGQYFRLLLEVNNLRIISRDGTTNILNDHQREVLYKALFSRRKLEVGKIRKLLEIQDDDILSIENSKRRFIKGNEVEYLLRKTIGTKWDEFNSIQREEINNLLITGESFEKINLSLNEKFKFELKQDIELPGGYFNFSLKAIKKLIPLLETGLDCSTAIKQLFGNNKETPTLEKLPIPNLASITNPIVKKAMYEVRKVVNAIIRKYGKPSKIIVELAREAKGSKVDREKYLKQIKRREAERDEAKNYILEYGCTVNRDNIERYLLWRECQEECPYTGRAISPRQLFSSDINIEHILPFSRSLDNSFMNKTLSFASENREKLNRTPWEAYGETDQYEEILYRVKKLPWNKRKRFIQKELNLEKILDRELNDTRYINKVIRDYLLVLGIPVNTLRGGLTAMMRNIWGFNKILSSSSKKKNRDDNRHHAVDAVVLTLCNPKIIKGLSSTSLRNIYKPKQPWKTCWEDIKKSIEQIIVSYKPRRKILGPLHNDTAYGPTRNEESWVVRKKINELNATWINSIRDEGIKEIIVDTLKNKQINYQKDLKNKTIPEVLKDRFIMPSGIPIKRVRCLYTMKKTIKMKNSNGSTRVAYKPDNNHHIEIYKDIPSGKQLFDVINMFIAAKRVRRDKIEATNRISDKKREFIMSLCKNDVVEITKGPHIKRVLRVSKIVTDGRISFKDINDARPGKEGEIVISASSIKAKKLSISPIGEVSLSND